MKIINNKIKLLNKFILFSSSLLVIFLFGIFVGSKIKDFKKPSNTTNIEASSAEAVDVNVPYKVIKEVKK
ncbi:MAG: hypothetical protein HAW63_04370 [Bdellovibrionaceae bacterium]|nr:hypothetical protein [Pseudobdellovibrionaceae bacterium]